MDTRIRSVRSDINSIALEWIGLSSSPARVYLFAQSNVLTLSLLSPPSGGWCGSVPSCSKRAACGSLPSAVLGHNNGYIGSGYRLLLTSNIFHLVGDLCGHPFVCGGGCRVCVCEWPYQVAINNFPIILWVLSVTARMRQYSPP